MKKELRESQGVYATHVVEGEINYVLIASGTLGDRLSGNPSKLRRGVHHCKELQKVYDRTNIVKMEILQVCLSAKEARDLENDYMDFYKKLEGVVVLNKYPAVCSKEYKRILNKVKVIEIKMLLAEGKMKNKDIAAEYGCDSSLISKIKTGLLWSSVNIEKNESILVPSFLDNNASILS
ncbi:hypothetical protein [Clostridium estertheticum]|uniref:hypothetical protein n=1 Tax=Clostridium estertheticum TaxID=238834 RepID=UPI001CF1504E|nr:hypothetical protein [Clostridium estertheticum]MCB2354353.1 hypothetical protein [Clostridium estertheticum]WAG42528.1 hypothetical protein LL065_07600 [Clostridium estertheticum]